MFLPHFKFFLAKEETCRTPYCGFMDISKSSKNCHGLLLKTKVGAGKARKMGVHVHGWSEGVIVLHKRVWTRDTTPQSRACLPILITYGISSYCSCPGACSLALCRWCCDRWEVTCLRHLPPSHWEPSEGVLLLSLSSSLHLCQSYFRVQLDKMRP